MNYAQDRLDRRELLLSVLQKESETNPNDTNRGNNGTIDHTKHGQICMMLGWNIHALYHYGRAWYEQPTNCYRMGDYVQMMEMYGYPEIALLTIFVYRSFLMVTTTSHASPNNDMSNNSNDDHIRELLIPPPPTPLDVDHITSPTVVDRTGVNCNDDSTSAVASTTNDDGRYDRCAKDMIGTHCGCYDPLCGRRRRYYDHPDSDTFPCWTPMSKTAMYDVIVQLQSYGHQNIVRQYQHQCANGSTTTFSPSTTAHELLGEWTDSLQTQVTSYIHSSQGRIPEIFQFWNQKVTTSGSSSSDAPPSSSTAGITKYRPLVPVVQLLCIKLMYLIVPSLAIEAMVRIRYQQQQQHHSRLNPDNCGTSSSRRNSVTTTSNVTIEDTSSTFVEDDIRQSSKNKSNEWGKHLSNQYKSHWAYYIFIEALIFGERIKVSRRKLMMYHHMALWDRLWGIDVLNTTQNVTTNTTKTIQLNDVSKSTTNSFFHSHTQSVDTFIGNLKDLVDRICTPDYQNNTNEKNATPIMFPDPVWIQPILTFPQSTIVMSKCRPLFLLGDSHVLSLAWQLMNLPSSSSTVPPPKDKCDVSTQDSEVRLIVPIVITGLKAWHVRRETRFFTNTCLHAMIRRLPSDAKTIIISAGEIDCREGMGGPLLQGYTEECYHHVKATVEAYVSALIQIIQLPSNSVSQILITPVAPHIERNKGRVVGHASRRETIGVWNDELRRQLIPHRGTMYFLDYIEQIQVPIKKSNNSASAENDLYALNPIFNADSTHMNGAFVPIFEEAIVRCQCDISKL